MPEELHRYDYLSQVVYECHTQTSKDGREKEDNLKALLKLGMSGKEFDTNPTSRSNRVLGSYAVKKNIGVPEPEQLTEVKFSVDDSLLIIYSYLPDLDELQHHSDIDDHNVDDSDCLCYNALCNVMLR